jgi:hypothetical protein
MTVRRDLADGFGVASELECGNGLDSRSVGRSGFEDVAERRGRTGGNETKGVMEKDPWGVDTMRG